MFFKKKKRKKAPLPDLAENLNGLRPPYNIDAQQLHERWKLAAGYPPGEDRERMMTALVNDVILALADVQWYLARKEGHFERPLLRQNRIEAYIQPRLDVADSNLSRSRG